MIDDANIEKLMILMNKHNVNKVKIKHGETTLEIDKSSEFKKHYFNNANEHDAKLKKIKSPLIGICYLSPAPNQKPFIKEGDNIKKGDIICIIEVMKTLHQVKSDYSGIVSKIIVENEKPVEYNEDLVIIKNV